MREKKINNMKDAVSSIPYILSQAESFLPKNTPPVSLHDDDTFDDNTLTLQEIKNLKKVYRDKTLPVHYSHYNTASKISKAWPQNRWAVVDGEPLLESSEVYQTLATELDKPRKFPTPDLDRPLTKEDKEGVLRIIDNTTRDINYASISHSMKDVEVPINNGLSKERTRVIDTKIGRRLQEIYDELAALKKDLLAPYPEASDTTPVEPNKTWWLNKHQWDKDHVRRCSHCSSVYEVRLPS